MTIPFLIPPFYHEIPLRTSRPLTLCLSFWYRLSVTHAAHLPHALISRGLDLDLRRLILWLTIPLLLLPKINLVAVTGQTAGLRIDDLCLLCAGFIILCGLAVTWEVLTKTEKYFGCFLFCATVSAVLNWLLYYMNVLNAPANPLYVIRLTEYFTFFYVGQILMEHKGVLITAGMLFLVNSLVVLLQAGDIIGGFTVEGYTPSVSSQPTGLAAGHWEIGFIFNLLYALFLFNLPRRTIALVIPWMLINGLLVTLTGCRSAVLGMLAVTAYFLGKRLIIYAGLAVIATLLAYVVLAPDLSNLVLVTRSENLLNVENVSVFYQFFCDLDVGSDTYITFTERLGYLGSSLDESWFVRIYKWSYVIKYAFMHPVTWLLGLGPGFFGPAIDGGWIRLFTEYGVVGGVIYCAMLWKTSVGSRILVACLIALAVNSLFLDMFLAYKAMSLYFLLLGAYAVNRPHQADAGA